MKYIKHLTIALLIICMFSVTVFADSALPYSNYTYSEKGGGIVLGPDAYVPETVIYGETLGTTSLKEPTDIRVDEEGNIYILDAGNGRILILGEDYKLKAQINGFEKDGAAQNFTGAKGLYIDDAYIYVADTLNARIVIFNRADNSLAAVAPAPKSSVLGDDFKFAPISLVVDTDRLLYVVGEGVFEGIITMDWKGNFGGFIGSNKVTPSVWDQFWMTYATVEQRKTMVQYVPQDFSSIDIDEEGFYFVTTYTAQGGTMVKRLNPGGDSVFQNLSHVSTVGDPTHIYKGAQLGSSTFYDVSCGENNIFACIDYKRGKVFVYNEDGYLLFTFGAISQQEGGFTSPLALTWLDGKRVAVLDMYRGSVTIFKPTDYAMAIYEGVEAQSNLDYDLAFEKWQKVLALNNGFELAHIQVGKVYLNTGEYEEAMESFRMGNNKALFSKAMEKNRAEWLRENITTIFVIVLILVAIYFVRKVFIFFKQKTHKKQH